jgi:hypothetical protein
LQVREDVREVADGDERAALHHETVGGGEVDVAGVDPGGCRRLQVVAPQRPYVALRDDQRPAVGADLDAVEPESSTRLRCPRCVGRGPDGGPPVPVLAGDAEDLRGDRVGDVRRAVRADDDVVEEDRAVGRHAQGSEQLAVLGVDPEVGIARGRIRFGRVVTTRDVDPAVVVGGEPDCDAPAVPEGVVGVEPDLSAAFVDVSSVDLPAGHLADVKGLLVASHRDALEL